MSTKKPGTKAETSRSGGSRVYDVDRNLVSVDGKEARAGSKKPADHKKQEQPAEDKKSEPAKARKGG